MLSLQNVIFTYGSTVALKNISLTIREGEFIVLVGPNSSGKSTLLRVMAGSRRPEEGFVQLNSRALHTWPLRELAQTTTLVATESFFAFPFTVEQIVLLGRTPFIPRGGRETTKDRSIAADAMHETDVWHLRDRAIHQLSSGERQRVLLARALTQEPKLLLLDEPGAHLDVTHQVQFFECLRRLHKERGLTVVCALHDLAMAGRYADRVMMLKDGRLAADGTPKDVLTSSQIQNVFGLAVDFQWLSSGEPGLFLLNRA